MHQVIQGRRVERVWCAVHKVQRHHEQLQAGGSVPHCERVTISREHLPGGLGDGR